MLKSIIALSFVVFLVSAGQSSAQCVMGLYVDQAGTIGAADPFPQGTFIDAYMVMHVEATVAGAAFALEVPFGAYMNPISYGPNGLGLNIPRAGGQNVGLGECALGFNAQPVLIVHYNVYRTTTELNDIWIRVLPNTDENPSFPVYADCADNLLPCPQTSDLHLRGVGVEPRSLGNVKALYGG